MFESAAGLGGSGAVDAKALRPNADRRRLIPWPRHPGGQSALDPFVDLQAGRFAGFEAEFGVHPVSLRLSFSIQATWTICQDPFFRGFLKTDFSGFG
jgi:hypothetical protein